MEIIFWHKKINRLIQSLDDVTIKHVINCLDLLEEHGYLLDMPDSKSLSGGLFELRTQGKIKVRMLYVFHKDKAYIIHCFIKKTWKIPLRDIRYARNIQKSILSIA